MLVVEGLTYPATGRAIVADVTFSARPGARTALHGRSGAGKSTILKLLAGVISGGSGRTLVDDQPIVRSGRSSDAILVWQDQVLFEHMSVAQNVGFGLTARGVPPAEIERRVAQALASLDLAGYEARRPPSLSGGERARVAFARSYVVSPRVLLVDEVFANVDRRSRSLIFSLLDDFLAKDQRYAIYVSHSYDDLIAYADDVVVLDRGRVCEWGALQSILAHPRTAQGALVPAERIGLAGVVTRISETRVDVKIDSTTINLGKTQVIGSTSVGVGGVFVFSQATSRLMFQPKPGTLPVRIGRIMRINDAQTGVICKYGDVSVVVPIDKTFAPGRSDENAFIEVEGHFYTR